MKSIFLFYERTCILIYISPPEMAAVAEVLPEWKHAFTGRAKYRVVDDRLTDIRGWNGRSGIGNSYCHGFDLCVAIVTDPFVQCKE